MDPRTPGWTYLLQHHGQDFLDWAKANRILSCKFQALATALGTLLTERIRTRQDVELIWQAVPAVLKRCNEQSTYEMPGAPYAYAWLHLLDRYARTWCALEKLVKFACLPMARHGVHTLDVGTGPGPSAFAVCDFYAAMTQFGRERGVDKFHQPPTITCVEFDQGTNSLRHNLAEVLFAQTSQEWRPILNMCSALSDFHKIKPTAERIQLREKLRREEDENFDESMNSWIFEPRHSTHEVNAIAQSLHRYRMIVLSNFLTTVGVTESFESNLVDVLRDAHAGSVILVLGGKEGPYPEIVCAGREVRGWRSRSEAPRMLIM